MITQEDLNDLASDILNEEQREEYTRLIDEERRGRNEVAATARLNHMGPALNLSEDQRDTIYGIYYNEADQMSDGYFQKERYQEISEQTNAAIQEVLTDEQLKAYEEMSSSTIGFGVQSTNAVFISKP